MNIALAFALPIFGYIGALYRADIADWVDRNLHRRSYHRDAADIEAFARAVQVMRERQW